MLKFKLSILLCALLSFSALAADVKPSDESLKKLIEVTEVHKLVDSMFVQIDGILESSIQNFASKRVMTEEDKKAFETLKVKSNEIMRQELNWDYLEKFYIQSYSETFTQEEVDGMLVFYTSPAGQAMIKKMPLLMQKSMGEMQKRSGSLMQKMMKMQQETFAELNKKK